MSIQQSNEKKKPDGKKKREGNSPTKQTIKAKKDDYCKSLITLVGDLTTATENWKGTSTVYELKKCCFVKTEKNYRITRNLELQTGVELIQASADIENNVKASLTKNDSLVKALKAVCAAAKDAKVKFGELRDAAGKLNGCRNDSCNASQMIILGCKPAGECNEDAKKREGAQEPKIPQACENACCILDHLVSVPEIFSQDIDIIFNASTEIMGIQSFTSIKTLEKFQQDFKANAKSFDDWVAQKMKDGKTAVDGAQTELADATKNVTAAGYALYNARNAVETADSTKDYLCCHKCNCINDEEECGCHDLDDNSTDRLKSCKCQICDICEEVTGVYCEKPGTGQAVD
jgi:hypothetical protein